jgi:uncharacterized protein
MTDQATPLSEAETQKLEDLLGSEIFHGEAMAIDELQGLICAVVSGPEAIAPSHWMPLALGADPRYEDAEQVHETLELVMRFYNQNLQALIDGKGIDLILYHLPESEDYDYESWCCAYLDGVDLTEVPWEDTGDPEEVDELLFPLVVLAGELPEEGVDRLKPDEMERLVSACQEDLGSVLLDIHRYWLARRTPETVRRQTPKTGRNDPCPCGRGKKFKLCCGAPHNLH